MRRYIRTRLFSWATGRFISFHWWQEKSERTDRLFHCRTSHQSLDPLNRKLFALNTRNRKHVHFSNIPHFYHFLFSPLSRVFQRTKEQLFSNAHSEELCLLTLLRRITSSSSSSPHSPRDHTRTEKMSGQGNYAALHAAVTILRFGWCWWRQANRDLMEHSIKLGDCLGKGAFGSVYRVTMSRFFLIRDAHKTNDVMF